ncbi:MAG: Gfo/Idh/MocA family oxidoreductase [Armatimonadetes bacterium]|nr:Gfo/Idh/MocA family oxidoreductase [Armatimonadota bacterium]
MLRIGIIGAGGIVEQRHLPGFTAIDGVEIRAVANRTPESAQAVAQRWNIPHVETDWRALVARDDLDVVVVGTWPYLHRDATVAALMAGKHVFCQARMTMNAADARHMYEMAMLTDRVTALCPPPTVMAVDRLVRRLIADGLLGELRMVRVTALTNGATDEQRPPTWRERAAWSGQNTMTLGIWAEIVRNWCGDTREVWANNRVFVSERPNPSGGTYHVSIPDSVTALSTFECGAQGVWHLSSVAHAAGPEKVELFGSAGTIVAEAMRESVLVATAGETTLREVSVPPELANPWQVERNFVDAVRDGVPVLTSFHDGLKYAELVEAVHRSHSSGAMVRLPLAL